MDRDEMRAASNAEIHDYLTTLPPRLPDRDPIRDALLIVLERLEAADRRWEAVGTRLEALESSPRDDYSRVLLEYWAEKEAGGIRAGQEAGRASCHETFAGPDWMRAATAWLVDKGCPKEAAASVVKGTSTAEPGRRFRVALLWDGGWELLPERAEGS